MEQCPEAGAHDERRRRRTVSSLSTVLMLYNTLMPSVYLTLHLVFKIPRKVLAPTGTNRPHRTPMVKGRCLMTRSSNDNREREMFNDLASDLMNDEEQDPIVEALLHLGIFQQKQPLPRNIHALKNPESHGRIDESEEE